MSELTADQMRLAYSRHHPPVSKAAYFANLIEGQQHPGFYNRRFDKGGELIRGGKQIIVHGPLREAASR